MQHPHQPAGEPAPRAMITPLRVVLFTLLLLLAWAAYFLYSIMYAPVKVTTDYGRKAHEHVRARQSMPADAPSNWEVFELIAQKIDAAREAVQARNPDAPLEGFDPTYIFRPEAQPTGDIPRELCERIAREWLDEFRALGGFADLDALSGTPYAARPSQDGAVIGFLFMDLGKARAATRMNAARMFIASQMGDDADRLSAFEQSLAMGRILSAQMSLIEHLVGVAIHAVVQGELRTEIVEGTVSPVAAAALLEAMQRQRLSPLSATIDSERYFTLDTIQRTFSDTGNGNGRFMPTAAAELGGDFLPVPGSGRIGNYRVFNLAGLLHPDRKSTEQLANSIFDRMMQLADLPRDQRLASGISANFDGEITGNRVLEILMPALGRTMQSRDQYACERDAMRLMLALEVYRGRHGAYPESLGALAPDILPSIPLDAVSGTEFGYRRFEAPDEHGRGYLLYSFTNDGEDNGGFMGDRPPHSAFLTGGQSGLDFVFNQPRGKPAPPKALTVEPQEDHSNFQMEVAPPPESGGK
ncbi:MAG: hypothetical protein KF699_13185 [Phycisphaeraceae bacterium]|nr:hypothetical protein [Phycisphaeraceae bacterium]